MSQLPEKPNLEHLKNQAKRLLADLQRQNPRAQLADALHAVAREYGFASWPRLKVHVESIANGHNARTNPLAGRWTANPARSQQHSLNDARSTTLEFAVAGDAVTIVDLVVDAEGCEHRGENTLAVDGTEYVSERGTGYSVVARWVDTRALEAVMKREGQEVGRVTYAVSPDDRTLTLSASANAHDGYPASEQLVVFSRV